MVVRGASRGRVLYARWEIQEFRGIERFTDYKKIKARMRPVKDITPDVHALRRGKQGWHSVLSDKVLTTTIAVGTIILVVLAAATLVAMKL